MPILDRCDFSPDWNQLCPERYIDPDTPEPVRRWQFSAKFHAVSCGETVVVTAKLFDHDCIVDGEEAELTIQADFHGTETTKVKTSAAGLKLPVTLDQPGFVRIGLNANGTNGFYGIGFSVSKIKPAPEHPGFEAYWKKQLARLDAAPMKVLFCEPLSFPDYPDVESYNIRLSSVDETPVSLILSMPKGTTPGTLPAYAFFHGAGIRPPFPPLPWARNGFLAINVSALGLSYGLDADYLKERQTTLNGYPSIRSTDPEKIPFNSIVLRVVRSLQYLKSRPEWNGKALVVHGGSQGGWQSLVAAGLDHDVTYAQIEAPANCNVHGVLEGRTISWPRSVRPEEGHSIENDNAALFDGIAFGRRAKAQAVFTVGFSDKSAVPSSVFAAYNVYGGPRTLLPFPDLGHEQAVFWSGRKAILEAAGLDQD